MLWLAELRALVAERRTMQGMDKILCKSHRRELLKQLFYIVVLVPCLLCISSQNAPQPRDGLLEKAG